MRGLPRAGTLGGMDVVSASERAGTSAALRGVLERRFEAAVFDWDGTAVPDRRANAFPLRRLVERLSRSGFDLVVVSGTNVDNIDGQLRARPTGPGRLLLCLNRGSEVFAVGPDGPRLLRRRTATPNEDAALTAAAERVRERLAERGLWVEIVAARLNRRKLDLIPGSEWADPPKARIGELVAAVEARLRSVGIRSIAEVVDLARAVAADGGLSDPRVTSDAKHVEIGLTDKSDSAAWALADLWRHGISPAFVLLAGDEFGTLGNVPGSDALMLVPEAARATCVSVGVEPAGVPSHVLGLGGGPDAFLELLEGQLRLRESGEPPPIDEDPAWSLGIEGIDPELERVHESLLTLADGRIGTRGVALPDHRDAAPGVRAAGAYTNEGPEETLLPCPVWNRSPAGLRRGDRVRRVLDLRTGLLGQDLAGRGRRALRAVAFSSLARPGTAVLRVRGHEPLIPSGAPLEAPRDALFEQGALGDTHWIAAGGGAGIVAVAGEARSRPETARPYVDRVAVYAPRSGESLEPALRQLLRGRSAGFERLLHEHRSAWGRRWEACDVSIEGDPELQQAIRFALFHLIGSVADEGEAAVGARGLTGDAYRGHVFWDSDVYVLPFLAATHAPAARAMLEYRVRRLAAARAAAAGAGLAGARFPWESASMGDDVTPAHALLPTGEVVRIDTGEREEHVVAAVAWGVGCYLDWTGDREFEHGAGRTLLVETARYWASRARYDEGGAAHLDGVIGPDEYHGPVDDNAYTNVMARWNLRRAAAAVAASPGDAVEPREAGAWLELGEALVDGYDPETQLYEQFAGFFELEPLVIAELAPRPVAADALLGRERVAGAQILKQADTLMLHHLVPAEVAPGSLAPNIDFYETRTAHGSSLSPGIHAALLARLGRLDEALELLCLAARIDLDDLTGTTAGGLHLAAMGSVWQVLAYGFAGLRPHGRQLAVDPRLPAAWPALELRVRFRGAGLRLRLEADALVAVADRPTTLHLPGSSPVDVSREGVRLARRDGSWEVV
ncbi:MAG TPA: glycosyl hydrolase family 65 protein [Gaiellaceae bacterium]|nr:glycosyl hydrolase family 65 protein [Gaiellaceae bacterium]